MKRKYKVGVYAHYDPSSYEEEKHTSLKRQLRTIHSFLDADKDFEVVEEYLDTGDRSSDNEVFEKLLYDIDEYKIDCVVVRSIEVVGRNYQEAVDFLSKYCPFAEVRLIAVKDNYDSEKDNKWTWKRRYHLADETVRRSLSRNIFDSRNRNWEEGKYHLGPVPYGYIRIDNRLYIDPDTAPIVKNIFERYLRNDRAYEIARDLKEMNVLSPRAYEVFQRTGQVTDRYNWKDCTVWRILRSRFYVGDTVHTQHKKHPDEERAKQHLDKEDWIIVPNTHEPIISREMFDEVQERIAQISAGKILPKGYSGPRTHGISTNCYKGKIFCGVCGRPGSYRTDGNYIVYRCRSIDVKATNCGTRPAHLKYVNEAVIDVLRLRYGLWIEELTQEHIDKYVKRILFYGKDSVYVELNDDHIEGDDTDGKEK